MSSSSLRVFTRENTLHICAGGRWSQHDALPDLPGAQQQLRADAAASAGVCAVGTESEQGLLLLEVEDLDPDWDSTLPAYFLSLVGIARTLNYQINYSALPDGLHRLLDLALAVPAREGAARSSQDESFLERLGGRALAVPKHMFDFLEFLGDVTLELKATLKGRSPFRMRDLFLYMQECSIDALPIVSLISMLVGLILAFVGAVQLQLFGAQIYVAGLVAIGVTRVMGAIMVGIVMSGRTGAAYAAILGSMQVNEEIDALSTFGFSPVGFLVLPRILALTIMVPLLTLYADLMGMLGGMLVGVLMLDLGVIEYFKATQDMLGLSHVWVGLVHAVSFGAIIGLSSCYQGIRCGRSASAVGMATTTAVVNSIVGIIVATAIITVLFQVLHI